MAHPPASFASVARHVSGWTSNLLAAAIVIVLGLALGWQVLAWWHDQPLSAAAIAAQEALPQLPDAREFLTNHGTLKVERLRGEPDQILQALRAYYRTSASSVINQAPAHESPSRSEQRLLKDLQGQTALEQTGNLALYQPPDQELMIAAVDRSQQRIVGWSFALPAGDGAWSIYHVQPRTVQGRPSEQVGVRP